MRRPRALVTRSCACGCPCRFRVLPKSPQKYASMECRELDNKIPMAQKKKWFREAIRKRAVKGRGKKSLDPGEFRGDDDYL